MIYQGTCTNCQTPQVWTGDTPPTIDCPTGGTCKLAGTPVMGAALVDEREEPTADDHAVVSVGGVKVLARGAAKLQALGHAVPAGTATVTCSCGEVVEGADEAEARKRHAEHRVDAHVKAGAIPEQGHRS